MSERLTNYFSTGCIRRMARSVAMRLASTIRVTMLFCTPVMGPRVINYGCMTPL